MDGGGQRRETIVHQDEGGKKQIRLGNAEEIHDTERSGRFPFIESGDHFQRQTMVAIELFAVLNDIVRRQLVSEKIAAFMHCRLYRGRYCSIQCVSAMVSPVSE